MASGEQQHQEALVAGESPDRAERERSSGETTEGGGVVARPEETAENESRNGAGTPAVPAPASPAGEPDESPGDAEGAGEDEAAGVRESAPEGDAEGPATPKGSEGGTGASQGSARAVAEDGADAERQGDSTESGKRDEGDARLKSAVAAWVAGDGPGEDAGTAASGEDAGPEAGDAASGGAGTSPSGDRSASTDLPVRPKPAEEKRSGKAARKSSGGSAEPSDAASDAASDTGESAAAAESGKSSGSGKSAGRSKTAKSSKGAASAKSAKPSTGDDGSTGRAPEGDAPTAMFGIVRPGEGAGDKDGDESAADRAERLTSAFFGSPKDGKQEAEPAAGAAGDDDAGTTDAKGPDAPPVDQPTATFRTKDATGGAKGATKDTAKGGAKSGSGGAAGAAKGGTKDESAKGGSEAAPSAPAVDQPTAVFRAPDVKKAGDTGKDAKAAGTGGKGSPASAGAGADAAKDADGDKDTKGAGKGTKDGEGSTAPKGGAGTADPRVRREAESDAERTSQFVPLKSTDLPRTPAKPLPPNAPAGAPPAPPAPPKPPAAPGALPSQGAPDAGPELTKQQPAPEAPAEGASGSQQPLDLLAQLTNTPPPPETPLRTMTRRVKIWTPLVLLLAVVFVVVQAVRPLPGPELSMTAAETSTFEGAKPSVPWPSEGQAVLEVDGLGSLGSYGEQKPVPIASVAKVMTAYVILRDHPVKKGSDGKTIPVDKKAEDDAGLSAQNESTVEVKEGDKITQREAIDAIMIASANNVARLLARWDAGSEKAFVKKMNDAAKDLGMTNSKYTDPSGLKAETVSTAADQVKLGKKVMEIPLFREVVRQPSYKDAKGETQLNWNRLVPLDGVVGIKTGTTTKAGGNLLFAAEKEIGGTQQLIVGAVLGQYKPSILDTVLAESKKLIDTAQDSLETKKVVKKGDVVGYVDDKLGGHTPVVATKDVSAVGWPGLKVKLGLTDNGKSLPHEAKAGTKVGTLTVGDGPGQVKVPVALKEALGEPGFGSKLTRVG